MALSLISYAAQSPSPMTHKLVERVTNKSAFLKVLKFLKATGLDYKYAVRKAQPAAGGRALNALYTAGQSLITPEVETLVVMGGKSTPDSVIVESPNGQTVRAREIGGLVNSTGLNFDKYVIKGDPAVDPTQFTGLQARCSGSQLITAGTNGANCTRGMVDQTIDAVVGSEENKVLICDKYIRRQLTILKAGISAFSQDAQNLIQIKSWNDIPIIVLDEDGQQTPILSQNETCGNSSVTTSLYCAKLGGDADEEYLQGIIGLDGEIKVRQVGCLGEYYLDVVELVVGIGTFHPRTVARLKGLL